MGIVYTTADGWRIEKSEGKHIIFNRQGEEVDTEVSFEEAYSLLWIYKKQPKDGSNV